MKSGVAVFVIVAMLSLLLFLYLRHQISLQDQKTDRLALKCARVIKETDVTNIVQNMPEFQLLMSDSASVDRRAGVAAHAAVHSTVENQSKLGTEVLRHSEIIGLLQQQQKQLSDDLARLQQLSERSLTELQQLDHKLSANRSAHTTDDATYFDRVEGSATGSSHQSSPKTETQSAPLSGSIPAYSANPTRSHYRSNTGRGRSRTENHDGKRASASVEYPNVDTLKSQSEHTENAAVDEMSPIEHGLNVSIPTEEEIPDDPSRNSAPPLNLNFKLDVANSNRTVTI